MYHSEISLLTNLYFFFRAYYQIGCDVLFFEIFISFLPMSWFNLIIIYQIFVGGSRDMYPPTEKTTEEMNKCSLQLSNSCVVLIWWNHYMHTGQAK